MNLPVISASFLLSSSIMSYFKMTKIIITLCHQRTNSSFNMSIMNDSNRHPERNTWPGFRRSFCGQSYRSSGTVSQRCPVPHVGPFARQWASTANQKCLWSEPPHNGWPTSNGRHNDLSAMRSAKVTSQSVCVSADWNRPRLLGGLESQKHLL